MNLIVTTSGAQIVLGRADNGFAQLPRQGRERNGRDDVVRRIRADLVQPGADVLRTVLGNDETGVTDGAHIVAEVFADLEGDHLPVGVEAIQNVFRDNAVSGAELNDHAGGAEVDPVNGRRAERGTAAGESPGSTDIAKAFE